MRPSQSCLPRTLSPFVPIISLLACIVLLAAPQSVFAEGSGTLYPGNGIANAARANIEWRSSNYGPNLKRRTLFKVFANKDEYILLASSGVAAGVGSKGDILLYAPDNPVTGVVGAEIIPATPSFSCLAQRNLTKNPQQGRIANRAQEVAGPDTIIDVASAEPGGAVVDGYVPCYFKAPAKGLYWVVFLGPSGNNNNDEPPATGMVAQNADNFNMNQKSSVAAWDVTVRTQIDDASTIKRGRLFTYYLAANTGGNGRKVQSAVYVVTTDGFRYRVSSNGIDPWGWVSYANQVGFLDGGKPLYHDVLADPTLNAQDQNQLQQLQGNVTLADPEYPMFVEQPDVEALDALNLPREPLIPFVSDLAFVGPAGTNATIEGKGGDFTFTTTTSGVYEVVISRDGANFDASNPNNRALRGVLKAHGAVTVAWDGRDNKGENFPVGDQYVARMENHGGEVHFPALDIENSTAGGPEMRLTNPPGPNCFQFNNVCSGAFYDDRGYQTSNGTIVGQVNGSLCANDNGMPPTSLVSPVTSYNSSGTDRAFGFDVGGNANEKVCDPDGGFGDKKGLDKWTYYPSNVVYAPLRIVAPQAVSLSSFTVGGTQVRWTTASEFNTLGFHILRSPDANRAHAQRVTTALVPARGGPSQGATYLWVDHSAQPGQAYSYWLQEIEAGGVNEFGPATSARTAGFGTHLYLPFTWR